MKEQGKVVTHLTTADIAKMAGLTFEEADRFLKAVIEGLKNVGEVHLTEFGQFRVSVLPERCYPPPQDGQPHPARKVIRFTRSRVASAILNGQREGLK